MKKGNIFFLLILILGIYFILPNNVKATPINGDNIFQNTVQIADITTCTGSNDSLLGDINDEESVAWLLNTIFSYVKILGPFLVIVLSSMDFIKAIVASDEENMKKSQKRFIIRLILAIALFLVPYFVEIMFEWTGIMTNDPTCGLNTIK